MKAGSLLQQLRSDFPKIKFIESDLYSWSPLSNEIYYRLPLSVYSLLHELGHALCKHRSYQLDIQLLKLEVEAWEKAQQLATTYKLKVPQAHINRCLDTYRDWVLSRAKCPDCDLVGLQSANNLRYSCCNCQMQWKVPSESSCLVRRIKTPL